MDNKKRENLIEKVKEFFSSHDIPAEVVTKEVKEKFETVLLADGVTEITIEPAIEVGAAAAVTAEDGTVVPAPVGEHELQDGRVIVIAEEGIVSEVKEAVAEEEPMATDTPSNAESVKRVVESIITEKQYAKQIEDLKAENESLKAQVKFNQENGEALVEKFNELKAFTNEVLNTLLDEPSKEPVKKPKAFALQTSGENYFLSRANKKKENEQV